MALDQRGHGHVAGHATEAVEIEQLSSAGPPLEPRVTVAQRLAFPRVPVRMAVVVIVLVIVVMLVLVIVRVPAHDASKLGGLVTRLRHGRTTPLNCRTTAIAAPKPLSILTTVTPEAQLVSMPNRAVNPDTAVP